MDLPSPGTMAEAERLAAQNPDLATEEIKQLWALKYGKTKDLGEEWAQELQEVIFEQKHAVTNSAASKEDGGDMTMPSGAAKGAGGQAGDAGRQTVEAAAAGQNVLAVGDAGLRVAAAESTMEVAAEQNSLAGKCATGDAGRRVAAAELSMEMAAELKQNSLAGKCATGDAGLRVAAAELSMEVAAELEQNSLAGKRATGDAGLRVAAAESATEVAAEQNSLAGKCATAGDAGLRVAAAESAMEVAAEQISLAGKCATGDAGLRVAGWRCLLSRTVCQADARMGMLAYWRLLRSRTVWEATPPAPTLLLPSHTQLRHLQPPMRRASQTTGCERFLSWWMSRTRPWRRLWRLARGRRRRGRARRTRRAKSAWQRTL